MLATIRLILGGIIFAQTLRWAWAWWQERRHPRYGRLPWDPMLAIRIGPLTGIEYRQAIAREAELGR